MGLFKGFDCVGFFYSSPLKGTLAGTLKGALEGTLQGNLKGTRGIGVLRILRCSDFSGKGAGSKSQV